MTPDPVYLTYVGPGDEYTLRYTFGEYRCEIRAISGVPVAVPDDLAADLLRDQHSWTEVDPADAVDAILAHDTEKAETERQWRARLDDVLVKRRRQVELVELAVAAADVQRDAFRKALVKQQKKPVALAAARQARDRFAAQLVELRDAGG